MNNNFLKRFVAYFIDLIILSIIVSFVSSLFSNDNIGILNGELTGLGNSFAEGEIETGVFLNRYSSLIFSLDKEMYISNLITVVIYVLYFVLFPLYNKGMSIGKKLMGIKIVNDDESSVDCNRLLIRYLLMNGLGITILSLCLIFILNEMYYMFFLGIFGILQFLVFIISVFMVLYRGDKKSLPDLIAGTKVIEVKK